MPSQLNPDILSLIFIHAFQDTSSALFRLRSVNRAWFEISGSTPQLWTRLVLNRKSDFENPEYAQFYLPKSGALPIDVRIVLPHGVDMNGIGGVTALLQKHVSRFRSFELHVQIHDQMETFISSIGEGTPAPLLDHLVLKVQWCATNSTIIDFLSLPTAFTPSPRLTHLELPGWPLPKTFPHLPTITSFTIDSMALDSIHVHQVVPFLDSTPYLQHFTFKGRDDYSYNIVSRFNYPHIIYLPNLLTADVTAPGGGADLLRTISAPALTHARLDGFREHHFEGRWEESLTEPLSVTLHRLSKRSRNLRCLALEYTEFLAPLEDYALIFSSAGFPHLEELLLVATDITDEALSGTSGGSNLKRLELRDCERVTGSGLLAFVRGRGGNFSLVLRGCRYVTQQDIVALSTIVNIEVQ